MSARSDNTVVIIGSGPGIGSHTASIFASKRFNKVALVARSTVQLEKDAVSVSSAAPGQVQVKTYSTDIVDSRKLAATLAQIKTDLGTPEFILFNAAIIAMSPLLEFNDEGIVRDFQISTVALYNTAKWAIPELSALAKQDPTAKPTLTVTNSHLPETPVADLFSLSLTKASQKNLTLSLRDKFADQGIHVCLLAVAGTVRDENPNLNNKNVACKAWDLYNQEKSAWTKEIRINP
ncbi:NAD(P)-binding protein [Trichoderma austrokoningii]